MDSTHSESTANTEYQQLLPSPPPPATSSYLARFIRAKEPEPLPTAQALPTTQALPTAQALSTTPQTHGRCCLYDGIDAPKATAAAATAATATATTATATANTQKRKRSCLSAAEKERLTRAGFFSAEFDDVAGLHAAVEAGLDILGARDEYGWTLLMVAVSSGHEQVVRYLLTHHRGKLEMNVQDATGCDAQKMAHVNGYESIARLLAHPPLLVEQDDDKGEWKSFYTGHLHTYCTHITYTHITSHHITRAFHSFLLPTTLHS